MNGSLVIPKIAGMLSTAKMRSMMPMTAIVRKIGVKTRFPAFMIQKRSSLKSLLT